MGTSAREALQTGTAHDRGRRHGEHRDGLGETAEEKRTRVFVAAENRLLRDALSRMMAKRSDIEVVEASSAAPFNAAMLAVESVDILLMTSRGDLSEDLALIRKLRATAPLVRILLLGVTGDDGQFLQYVRAGIKGYLLRDATAEDVLNAVKELQTGHAVCPGALCAQMFRYFESEGMMLPSATLRQRLGLTRREQQLIPLVARGMTNKEIANQFCLSEQTVKNHLYRMKHKVGAEDRLGIVQVCRTQGFMV